MKADQKVVSTSKKWLMRYVVAIHGYWISAIPAEMTSCVDTYMLKFNSLSRCTPMGRMFTCGYHSFDHHPDGFLKMLPQKGALIRD